MEIKVNTLPGGNFRIQINDFSYTLPQNAAICLQDALMKVIEERVCEDWYIKEDEPTSSYA